MQGTETRAHHGNGGRTTSIEGGAASVEGRATVVERREKFNAVQYEELPGSGRRKLGIVEKSTECLRTVSTRLVTYDYLTGS